MSKYAWGKSSYSTAQSNCVEVAILPDAVAVRDSKNPDGLKLTVTPAAWSDFVADIQHGQFSL